MTSSLRPSEPRSARHRSRASSYRQLSPGSRWRMILLASICQWSSDKTRALHRTVVTLTKNPEHGHRLAVASIRWQKY